MKKQLLLTVSSNRVVAPGWHHMVLEGTDLPPVTPGQFVEVAAPHGATLLNRPISIFDATATTLELVIAPVGDGTKAICDAKVGDSLRVIMPLGKGFTTEFPVGSKVLLVGGGVGIAPLYMQLCTLIDAGVKAEVLFGLRSRPDAEFCKQYEALAPIHICTDDGSFGHHGLVTSHPAFGQHYDMIQMCGPKPMMRAVAASAAERGIPAEASLENMMACGLGACLCCVEPTEKGNLCVCKDGPVFNTSLLTW
ncbi:MAG: dihydroorotate dehydrogenase electron transfer subunit [Muribaculaceae bacterium]|nr:dihydroorotate dehydrogenase electron transfer subunit [Muribaculaceae bacterium]